MAVRELSYFEELKRTMRWLGEKEDTIFLGQAVGCDGTAITNTLKEVPLSKRLELPVFEETQLGMSLGLSLEGFVPISIFPRWNFFILAMNQLVNHLDKYPIISDYRPKVIIRVSCGSVVPLDPQAQHKGDFTEAIQMMLETIPVVRLEHPEDVFPAYQEAYKRNGSTILCEIADFYDENFRKNYQLFNLTNGR